MDSGVVIGVLGLLLGSGGIASFFVARAQARKVRAEAEKVEVDTDIVEQKVRPEIDAIVADTLGKTATTLSTENQRLVKRLGDADATIEQQARTIREQAITIDKQNDTITDYRRQVAELTRKLAAAESMLNDVRNQLTALQRMYPDPPGAAV